MGHIQQIRELLDGVRARWRQLTLLDGALRAALAAVGVVAFALTLAHWIPRQPLALAALGTLTLASAVLAALWGFVSTRAVLSDRTIARFIEEREPSLDDSLVSAVSILETDAGSSALVPAMLASAARSIARVNPADIVPAPRLRQARLRAAAAIVLLLAVLVAGRRTVEQSIDAIKLTLFPSHASWQVTPGNVRIQEDSPLTIEARLLGTRAPVAAELLQADGDVWRRTGMTVSASETFTVRLDAVHASFKYRIAAGALTSPTYDVVVARAPRVTRIDVDYTYPAELGLAPRTDQDSGDIYAPVGTEARLRVETDRPTASGQMTLADGTKVPLAGQSTTFTAKLKVVDDTSYRVALVDREGLGNPGDTEYFVRVLTDRAPDVRIVKPARDRSVTPLEEVEIEAEADDDHGVDRLELVYAVRGGAEKTIPLTIPHQARSAIGRHTMYLEDLGVRPGDFVAYYARARDLPRGRRASEARSDLFFLEVKPFEREFALSQNASGGSSGTSLDDLVAAQKDVVIATWKLDRRTEAAEGAKSAQDIRSVGRAESELMTRVENMSSGFRESTMRDPRRPGSAASPGQKLPEENATGAALAAMEQAVAALNALNTSTALPPELVALDALLKAQGDVKKREISSQQQAGSANTQNRSNVDTSAMFDKELQRQQQTNYEPPKTSDARQPDNSMLDKVKDLARRQDELNRRQQDLNAQQKRMSVDELKRELEKLTRDQTDLRQRAEDLAREMNEASKSSPQDGSRQSQQGGSQQGQKGTGQRGASGQQQASGQQEQGQAGGSSGKGSEQRGSGDGGRQMRDVTEEMRNAASGLRRQDAGAASEGGARALDKLQALEQQLQNAGPNEQRRQMGELQLEARQLADAERQAASDLARAGQGAAGKDALRRLAGDQERLAARADRVQQALKQAAAGGTQGSSGKDADENRRAASEAAREADRQRLTERMRQAADGIRAQAGDGPSPKGDPSQGRPADTAAAEQEIARALDRMADSLAPSGQPRDDESRKLADQRTRAQGLRDQIEKLAGEAGKMQDSSRSEGAGGSQKAS